MQRKATRPPQPQAYPSPRPVYGPFISDFIAYASNVYRACIFQGAQLRNHSISQGLSFEDCRFEGYCDFEGSIFTGRLEFKNCIFTEFVMFRGARLPDRAVFENCRFEKGISFAAGLSHATDQPSQELTLHHLRFRGSHFFDYTTFNNRTFQRSADFQKCHFIDPPHFQNTIFHHGTRFEQAVFWPIKTRDKIRLSRAELGFRRLKTIMSDLGDIERQCEFLALELRTRRRRKETPIVEKLLIYLYEFGSDFGRSPVRPPIFLLAVSLIGWIILTTLTINTEVSAGDVGWYLIEQTFAPYRALQSDYQPAPALQSSYTSFRSAFCLIAGIQSSAALTTLTLFALAVRRRFSA